MASAVNHAWYKPIFYCLDETAACCYFGAYLGNGLDYYSLSRLTDGTPHSSSDLLYFTLLLLFYFYLDKLFSFPFCFFAQNFSKSKSSCIFSFDENILTPTSILQKYPKTVPNSALAAKSFESRRNVLSPIFFLTWENSLFFAYPFNTLAPGV